MPHEASIVEIDLGEGDQAFAVMLPAAPYDEILVVSPDKSPNSQALLKELCPHWGALWPKILNKLEEGIAKHGEETVLEDEEFIAEVSRLEPGVYMADKADIFFRLEFDEPPLWDCFIKGDELVHFQPVF
ncbi:hypothetical protein [Haloferula sp. BvORR071]|uniref:hypothetical protein n=1 Tax=Haloferula sp. BvORR071 TaxID=1396141 RepID=UPI000551DD1C|nr:hypothetical protein [Haloferula sp. BvORR071]